jgi:hypothetical protein
MMNNHSERNSTLMNAAGWNRICFGGRKLQRLTGLSNKHSLEPLKPLYHKSNFKRASMRHSAPYLSIASDCEVATDSQPRPSPGRRQSRTTLALRWTKWLRSHLEIESMAGSARCTPGT